MEKKFLVPAASFITAVLLWTALFVVYLSGSLTQEPELWLKAAISAVVGGLILFSGIRCYRAGGPKMGSIVRAMVLLVLALLTFWKSGPLEAAVLLVFAAGLLVQAQTGRYEPDAPAGSNE